MRRGAAPVPIATMYSMATKKALWLTAACRPCSAGTPAESVMPRSPCMRVLSTLPDSHR